MQPLFRPFRALGYISDNVPFAVQRRGKETFVTVGVGKAWQVHAWHRNCSAPFMKCRAELCTAITGVLLLQAWRQACRTPGWSIYAAHLSFDAMTVV